MLSVLESRADISHYSNDVDAHFLGFAIISGRSKIHMGSGKRARVRLITLATATIDLWFDSKQHILVRVWVLQVQRF